MNTQKNTSSVWTTLWQEAVKLCEQESALAPLIENTITCTRNLPEATARLLSQKLAHPHLTEETLFPLFESFIAHETVPVMNDILSSDIEAILKNDPAAKDTVSPFLFFKGYHALQSYRLAHHLWNTRHQHLARFIQNRMSDLFGVDIHPAAKIGKGVMMDHATGIVIGETAVVEDDVLFWHSVTLGGKDPTKIGGDRHPKIRQGAILGVGCTILGNIEIGRGAKVAANSVVLENVVDGVTVAGVPARPV